MISINPIVNCYNNDDDRDDNYNNHDDHDE